VLEAGDGAEAAVVVQHEGLGAGRALVDGNGSNARLLATRSAVSRPSRQHCPDVLSGALTLPAVKIAGPSAKTARSGTNSPLKITPSQARSRCCPCVSIVTASTCCLPLISTIRLFSSTGTP